MLSAQGLRKRYKARDVVRNFGMHVAEGEVVGLLGPNGAGKTTCFYMIVGLIPSDGGKILLDGEDISALPMHARAVRGIGYLPQEPSVFRRMTVADNVMAILELRRDLDKQARVDQLDELLERPDFLSVGSNDLMQFLYAADRGNTLVSSRFDPLSAPVLRAFKDIAEATKDGCPISKALLGNVDITVDAQLV